MHVWAEFWPSCGFYRDSLNHLVKQLIHSFEKIRFSHYWAWKISAEEYCWQNGAMWGLLNTHVMSVSLEKSRKSISESHRSDQTNEAPGKLHMIVIIYDLFVFFKPSQLFSYKSIFIMQCKSTFSVLCSYTEYFTLISEAFLPFIQSFLTILDIFASFLCQMFTLSSMGIMRCTKLLLIKWNQYQ